MPRFHPDRAAIVGALTAALGAPQPTPAQGTTPTAPTAPTAPAGVPTAADSLAARFTVDKFLDMERVGDPQISPDGTRIVYTRGFVNKLTDRWESALWMVSADGRTHHFLAKGANAVWSPDGTRLAYVAPGEPSGPQLFVRYMNADGATSQVTRVTEPVADLRWSPDGRQIGFTMFVPQSSPWKIDLPAAPTGASWTPAPKHITALHYRQDRKGFDRPGSTHLFAVAADGGTPRQLTQGPGHVGYRFDGQGGAVGYDWTPDGRSIVVEGMLDTTSDRNYRNSNLYAVDVTSCATAGTRCTVRLLTPQAGAWSNPAVSPDGRSIAYAGHPDTRASYQAASVWLMPLADGQAQARKLSGALDDDPGTLLWSRDGRQVLFTVGQRGAADVWAASPSGGEPRRVTRGAHMLQLASVARGGVAAAMRSTATEPPDVVRLDLASGNTTRLTAVNEDLLGRLTLGAVESFDYASSGGARVQGWLVKPPGFDASRKYPMIMEIHGGPHAAYNGAFNPQFQNFAAHGFLVLYTNPRGSTGYGSAFGNAIERAYPSVDYDDLMAGVDAAIAKGSVDTTRMYVGGCSGGGVLSSWVIGHTDRFAAAAVRCPVINWLSFAGQTDVPYFTYNFFDKPFWEDPTRWLQQSSLMHVGKVTTPTLLMTGELDLRTPMPQTEEYYSALKMRGVPSELLRFEGEFHGTGSRPSNWMRTQLYMMSWYGKWKREGGRPVANRGSVAAQ
ncbi:MAG: prolyl oligopeptidase family serine peptidase [Gemmatirosa sp.]